jgi:tetratricopeptide (TPR) repeat protein
MKRLLTITLVAVFALGMVSCAKLQARDNVNKGVRSFRDGKYDAAIDYFTEAIKLDPDAPYAQLYLATAYAQSYIPGAQSEDNQKNADMAIATFKKVLEKDPNNVTAVTGLASIYQNTDQIQQAREMYLKNAQMAPDDPTPHYAVGSIDWIIVFDKAAPPPPEEQAKLIDEGLSHLDQALQKNPDYEDAMTYKNLLFREKARLASTEQEKTQLIAQADEWFNKALETRKKNQAKAAASAVGANAGAGAAAGGQ